MRNEESVSLVCAKCVRPLDGTDKYEVGGQLYCEEHGLALARQHDPSLTVESFSRAVCKVRVAGISDLYLYMPGPRKPTTKN